MSFKKKFEKMLRMMLALVLLVSGIVIFPESTLAASRYTMSSQKNYNYVKGSWKVSSDWKDVLSNGKVTKRISNSYSYKDGEKDLVTPKKTVTEDIYTYSGGLITKVTTKRGGQLVETAKYTRNKSGKITKIKVLNAKGNLKETTSYTYKDGKVNIVATVDSKGRKVRTITYRANGNLLKSVYFTNGIKSMEMNFNSRGDEISFTSYDVSTRKADYETTSSYVYDSGKKSKKTDLIKMHIGENVYKSKDVTNFYLTGYCTGYEKAMKKYSMNEKGKYVLSGEYTYTYAKDASGNNVARQTRLLVKGTKKTKVSKKEMTWRKLQ